jgi:3-oxoacyl-[acyl-carrier protein] reductase
VRALVTGASKGIGRATAKQLVADGFDLAAHYHRDRSGIEALEDELRPAGREVFTCAADLSQPVEVDRLASEIQSHWDSLDLLVHNAGVYPRKGFRALTRADFESCFQTNFFSAAELTGRLLPLLDRSASGRIVFVSSVLAFSGSRYGAHYASSKAALLGLARSLARELAPRITVNVVAPGSIDTAILAGDSPEVRAGRIREIPLQRLGTPEDVADAISFLASARASYITGATLHVSGGVRSD